MWQLNSRIARDACRGCVSREVEVHVIYGTADTAVALIRPARVSDPNNAIDRRSPAIVETFGQASGSVGRPATASRPATALRPVSQR